MEHISIREITKEDNVKLASVIRDALTEFNANKPGTVYFDESTDHLFELFSVDKAIYYVANMNGEIAGGAGIYPTDGLDDDVCELVKLYLSPAARGKGLGKMLMQQCFEFASIAGYKKVYLETMPELEIAVPMYEKMGFNYLPGPLGNSGHNGCGIWMIKNLF